MVKEAEAVPESLRGSDVDTIEVSVFIMYDEGVANLGLLLQEVLQEVKDLVKNFEGLRNVSLLVGSSKVPINEVDEKDIQDLEITARRYY